MGVPAVVLIATDDDGGRVERDLRAAVGDRNIRWVATTAAGVEVELAGAVGDRLPEGPPVAVIGVGSSGEAALEAAANHGCVDAFVLMRAPISEEGIRLVAEWRDLPVLAVADTADRAALKGGGRRLPRLEP
jgi:hypothetical protein